MDVAERRRQKLLARGQKLDKMKSGGAANPNLNEKEKVEEEVPKIPKTVSAPQTIGDVPTIDEAIKS